VASYRQARARLIEYRPKQAVGGSGIAGVAVIVVQIEDSDGKNGLGFSYVLGGDGGIVPQPA
jgi:hypothetical protein